MTSQKAATAREEVNWTQKYFLVADPEMEPCTVPTLAPVRNLSLTRATPVIGTLILASRVPSWLHDQLGAREHRLPGGCCPHVS